MRPPRSAAKHPGCCGMPQQAPAVGRVRSCSCSSIRTVTVGPGFSPDQPVRVAVAATGPAACNLPGSRTSPCRFSQHIDVTASEGFHLALNRYLSWEYRSAFCSPQGDTFRKLMHFSAEPMRKKPANWRFNVKKGGILCDAAHLTGCEACASQGRRCSSSRRRTAGCAHRRQARRAHGRAGCSCPRGTDGTG